MSTSAIGRVMVFFIGFLLVRAVAPAQAPTWQSVWPQYFELYDENGASHPDNPPTESNVFGAVQYVSLYYVASGPISSSTPGYTTGPLGNTGLPDVYGCEENASYDSGTTAFPVYWYYNTGNSASQPLPWVNVLSGTIVRAPWPAIGGDYQSASEPVSGSGITVRGFKVNGGYSLGTTAPAAGFPGSVAGIYFDTNICSQGGAEYGFAHNFSPVSDYFYYELPADQCAGSQGGHGAQSCYSVSEVVNPPLADLVSPSFGSSQSSNPMSLPKNHLGYYNYLWEAWVQPNGSGQYEFVAQVCDPETAYGCYWTYSVTPLQPVGSAAADAMARLYGSGSGMLGSERVSLVTGSNVAVTKEYLGPAYVVMYVGH